jgi:hypothetical protein
MQREEVLLKSLIRSGALHLRFMKSVSISLREFPHLRRVYHFHSIHRGAAAAGIPTARVAIATIVAMGKGIGMNMITGALTKVGVDPRRAAHN